MADERTEKSRAIDLAMSQIEKQFGKGSIMKLGSKGAVVPIAVISTGAISFDAALGIGGFPRGRVVEIFGPESSGKTTIALQVIAEAQKAGGMAAFVDAEHALDPAYAKKLGVDVDNLLVSQPDYGEQALEIAEALVRSGAIDVLVVDSVAALVPKAELDGEMGDSHMGLQARLMSQALRKLTGIVCKSRTCFIFINQIREKIGVMFGNPETTTGARAEVLLHRAHRYPPHRRHQGRRNRRRLPHPRQDCEEQSRGALPRGRVRPHVRRGHQPRRRPDRPGGYPRDRREVGIVVQLQGRAHRPGARERPPVPQGQPRHRPQDRGRGAQEAGHADARRKDAGPDAGANPDGRPRRQSAGGRGKTVGGM
jgi:RecA/RadA recombinase